MTNVGERILKLRKQLGLSAEEVAERAGVSAATIYRYENGEISRMRVDRLSPIARALSCSEAYLMGWTDDPFSKTVGRSKDGLIITEINEQRDREEKLLSLFRSMDDHDQRTLLKLARSLVDDDPM